MKYTRSAITQLTRWYKQVLIKCAYLNAAILAGAIMLPAAANADYSNITIDSDTGNAYTTGLEYKSTNYVQWVQSLLDDNVYLQSGGTLNTHNLTQNGDLYATGGNLNVSGGVLNIYNDSYINNNVALSLTNGATLNINPTSGSGVVFGANDSISSNSSINVTGGNLNVLDGATITNGTGTFTVAGGSVNIENKDSMKRVIYQSGGDLVINSAGELGEFAKNIITSGDGGNVTLHNVHYNAVISGSKDNVYFTQSEGSSLNNFGNIDAKNVYVGNSTATATATLRNQAGASIKTAADLVVKNGSTFINASGAALNVGQKMVVETGGLAQIVNAGNATIASIQNDGKVEFQGGTNTSAIVNASGDVAKGEVLFEDAGNNANVTQNTVTFKSVNAGTLTSQGDVEADTLVNSTTTLVNKGTLTVHSTLTNNSTITNDGINSELNLNGGNTTTPMSVAGTINGTGTTNINAGAVVEFAAGSAVSSAIHIAAATTTPAEAAGKLTANANSILGVVDNDGELKLTGGTITKDITGDGVTEIGDGTNTITVTNSALLDNSVVINDKATLTTAGSDNTAAASATAGITKTVANTGTLKLTGGTVVAAVTGTGSTVIDGDVVNNSLIKNAITINSGKSLTTSGSNNTAAASATAGITNTVANAGTLKLLGGYVLSDVTGAGTTEIGDGTSTLTVTNNAEINGNDISILANATLSSAANKIIDKNNLIANEGTLELTGGTTIDVTVTHVNAVNTADSGAGKTVINGFVVQESGKAIKSTSTAADAIKINAGKGLIANASDLDAKITNNGTLKLNGGQLDYALTGTGTTQVAGTVTNASTMSDNDIVINSGASLSTAANTVTDKDTSIVNDGTLELTGGTSMTATVNHVNAVTGTGQTVISGFVTQEVGKAITDTTTSPAIPAANAISVTGGLIANASDLKAKTTNTGTVKLIGGTLGTGYDITGGGTTVIGDGTSTLTVTNNAEINGNDISILANGTLSSAADKIIDNDRLIANEGTLELTGGAAIDDTVTHVNAVNTADSGAGKTVINGFVVQESGKAIKSTSTAADAIKINAGKGLIANASDLDAKITNNGTLKLNGGQLDYALTGTGTTQVAGTVTNASTMSDNDIVINSGASLSTAANTVTDKDTSIVNDGTLELTGGTSMTATVNHVNAVTGTGQTVISGFVTQEVGKAITDTTTSPAIPAANAISVTGGLIANASDLQAKTTNTGAIKLVGGTLGAGYDITGTAGTTTIDGTVTSNASIANTGGITVLDATASTAGTASQLTISASDVDTTVTNNGLVVLNDGTLASGDTITGSGKTTIDGDVTANALIDNTGGIEVLAATTATPTAASKLTIDADNVGVAVANSGEVVLSGDGTLAKDITGAGKTTVSGGKVVNNANITGGDIATTATGILETATNKISDANGIDNAGTLQLTSGSTPGTLTTAVDGGTLQISGDIVVGTDGVDVDNTVVDSGKTLSVGSHTFDAGAINNSGTIDVDITSADKGGTTYTGSNLKATSLTNTTGTVNFNVDTSVLDAQHADSGNLTLVQGLTSAITGNITVNGAANDGDNTYQVVANADGSIKLINNNSYADTSAAAAGSANNMSTAVAFDNAMTLANGTAAREVQKQLNLVSKKDAGAYAKALTDLAPTDSAVLTGVTQDFNNLIDMEVSNHLASGMNSGDPFENHGVWVQALYNHSEQDKSHSTPGFKGDTTGLAFGFDGKLDCNTTIGFGYAYGQSDIDSAGRNTDIDSHNIFAYGKYQPSEWFVRGMVNYGMADYKEKANVLGVHKKADYDVDNYGIRAYIGYDLDNGFTPETGLRYTHIEQDNYTDSLGQHVKTDEVDVLTAVVGVNYSTNVETKGYKWSPKAHLAFTYDITSDNANSTVNIGDSVYDIKGKKLNRFGTEAGVAAETSYGNWDFSVGYDLGLRDDYTSHTGMFKAKYNF